MNNLKFKKNDLFIENISIKKLAKKFATPFYCYSSNTIIQKYKKFELPFKNSDTIICYAVKANPNIAILKILSNLGAGANVFKQKTDEDIAIAKGLLRKAIDLDDNLIDAKVWLGRI